LSINIYAEMAVFKSFFILNYYNVHEKFFLKLIL
jgi:hypothetical protein